jgi:hypothetical protein
MFFLQSYLDFGYATFCCVTLWSSKNKTLMCSLLRNPNPTFCDDPPCPCETVPCLSLLVLYLQDRFPRGVDSIIVEYCHTTSCLPFAMQMFDQQKFEQRFAKTVANEKTENKVGLSELPFDDFRVTNNVIIYGEAAHIRTLTYYMLFRLRSLIRPCVLFQKGDKTILEDTVGNSMYDYVHPQMSEKLLSRMGTCAISHMKCQVLAITDFSSSPEMFETRRVISTWIGNWLSTDHTQLFGQWLLCDETFEKWLCDETFEKSEVRTGLSSKGMRHNTDYIFVQCRNDDKDDTYQWYLLQIYERHFKNHFDSYEAFHSIVVGCCDGQTKQQLSEEPMFFVATRRSIFYCQPIKKPDLPPFRLNQRV